MIIKLTYYRYWNWHYHNEYDDVLRKRFIGLWRFALTVEHLR